MYAGQDDSISRFAAAAVLTDKQHGYGGTELVIVCRGLNGFTIEGLRRIGIQRFLCGCWSQHRGTEITSSLSRAASKFDHSLSTTPFVKVLSLVIS